MPSAAAPPRKFAPEPVETTSRSSRGAAREPPSAPGQPPQSPPKSRRFAPEPVETTTMSSKQRSGDREQKPKPRRFAPEPVETSTMSSKPRNGKQEHTSTPRRATPEQSPSAKQRDDDENETTPKARRFTPQLEGTAQRSRRDQADAAKSGPAHAKFAPQPIETIYRTNRKPHADDEPVKRPPRKFAPILVDTAKRFRRAGDNSPTLSPHLKTESGHLLHAREHRKHMRGDKSPAAEGEDGAEVDPADKDAANRQILELRPELRRSLSPMDGSADSRPRSLTPQRSHSFRLPDLDTIESSESERDSQASSTSSSPGQGSPITTSDSSYHSNYKHATRIRESIDESFTQYILQLEAKKAEERLREQALAAFPNSDFHEPVAHYVNTEDDSDDTEIEDRPVTWDGYEDDLLLEMAARRESTAKVNWEQMELQRHAEKMEQERNAAKTTATEQPSPWWNPEATLGLGQQNDEMQSMRDRARPPMLGGDLKFPRCRSPEPARFDVTQGSTALRNQMCYLTEHADSERQAGDDCGLWRAPSGQTATPGRSTMRSSGSASPKGLWGGFCVDENGNEGVNDDILTPPTTGQTGLMTPRTEVANPFDHSFAKSRPATPGSGLKAPPTPTRNVHQPDLSTIEGILSAERELDNIMEREFPDSFITQVYNYLSLGYPSLARPFDEELSKISRIPIAELRQDDKKAKATPRGYIRLGSDFEGGGGEGMTEQSCMRWRALKLYVREWARQEKDMVKFDGLGGNWGTGARRGSWAI